MNTRPLRWLQYSKRLLIDKGVLFIYFARFLLICQLFIYVFISVEKPCCPIRQPTSLFAIPYAITQIWIRLNWMYEVCLQAYRCKIGLNRGLLRSVLASSVTALNYKVPGFEFSGFSDLFSYNTAFPSSPFVWGTRLKFLWRIQ